MNPISILEDIVQVGVTVAKRVDEVKFMKTELTHFSTMVHNVASVVLKFRGSCDWSRPDVHAALHMFAMSVKECLDLIDNITRKHPFMLFIKSSSYESRIDGAIRKLSFKLLLLNTAVSLIQIESQAGKAQPETSTAVPQATVPVESQAEVPVAPAGKAEESATEAVDESQIKPEEVAAE